MQQSDYRFKLAKNQPYPVLTLPMYLAVRAAVMSPLTGRFKHQASHDDIWLHYSSLQQQWRARVLDLREAGWGRLAGDDVKALKALRYCRNCPPCGVCVEPAARPCNAATICPSCYARQVILEPCRAFQAVRDLAPELVEHYELLTVSKSFTFDPQDSQSGDLRAWIQRSASASVESARKKFPASLGGFGAITIHPHTKPGCLVSRLAVILLVHRDDNTVLPGCSVSRYVFNAKETARAMGKTFTYPIGLMRGPAADVIPVLDVTAKHRYKMRHFFGVLQTAYKLEQEVVEAMKYARRKSPESFEFGAADKTSTSQARGIQNIPIVTPPDREPDTGAVEDIQSRDDADLASGANTTDGEEVMEVPTVERDKDEVVATPPQPAAPDSEPDGFVMPSTGFEPSKNTSVKQKRLPRTGSIDVAIAIPPSEPPRRDDDDFDPFAPNVGITVEQVVEIIPPQTPPTKRRQILPPGTVRGVAMANNTSATPKVPKKVPLAFRNPQKAPGA
jgi:hypothetical protein